ncbi:MAG: hypothetical protein V4530_06190 [Pseudomonadota bacterium]
MARGPKKSASPPSDHNEAELREIIRDNTDAIVALEKQRKNINDKISEKRSEIKALNIDMDAWKAGKRRYAMDKDVRSEFDRSITVVNAALGIPVQADLFGENDDENPIPDAA